jgi:hypothetical protein
MNMVRRLKLADGRGCNVVLVKLHRTKRGSRVPYKRHTDWLCQTARHVVWGRTWREAMARLSETLEAHTERRGQ